MNDQLRVQYDAISRTVLVQYKDNSEVLAEQFENKDSAEHAAKRHARDHWGYRTTEGTK
jgi:urease accessory protein UreE